MPGGEEDNLIPAGIVQQWFEHMLHPRAATLSARQRAAKYSSKVRWREAVDTTAIVIETALQKNATKLADIAAELRRTGMRVTLTHARVVLL